VIFEEAAHRGGSLQHRIAQLQADPTAMSRMRHAQHQLRMDYGGAAIIHNVHERMLHLATQCLGKNALMPKGSALGELERRFRHDVEDGRPLPQSAARLVVAACNSSALLAQPQALDLLERPSNLSRLLNAARNALPPAERAQSDIADMLHHVRARPLATSSDNTRLPRRRVIRVFLAGLRGNRTPLAHPPLQDLARGRIEYVSEPQEADLILTGFNLDFAENAEQMIALARRRPDVRFVVLSQEPLWDTTWSDGFEDRQRTLRHQGDELQYAMLNHANSTVYEFDRIPYVPLSSNKYPVRYRARMSEFASLTPRALLAHWQSVPIDAAFVAEARNGNIFRGGFPKHKIRRLSAYRTHIAKLCSLPNVVRVGRGWSDHQPDQEFPDWHLDKLTRFHGKVRILSAIENTHQRCYVTEKIFDAFAIGAIPVYHANPDHRVFDLVPAAAMINTWGESAESAAARINNFEATHGTAVAWLTTCRRLAELFGNTAAIDAERRRVVDEALRELSAITLAD
jgi:hypothetical protein